MTILSDLLNLFFPQLCVHCGKRLVEAEKYLCISCIGKLPRTRYCEITENKLEEFFAGRFPYCRIASFCYYVKGGIMPSVIHSLKYQNNPEIGFFLGSLCGQEMSGSAFLKGIDKIIPIPLHPLRERKRGYNQALKIAEGVSSRVNIPVDDKIIARVVNNDSQTRHSKFERWDNSSEIFRVTRPKQLENKHILLLDDVITTGSTIESCVKTILSACKNVKISIYGIASVN